MAQLNALQLMLVENKIRDVELSRIYGTRMHFPVTFRHRYAAWIESQDWEGFATSASHTNIGRLKFEELIQLMTNDMDAMQPLIRIDFKNSMDDFVDHYQNDYDNFIKMMNTILRTERILMQSSQEDMGEDRHFDVAKENTKITDDINKLSTKLKSTEKMLIQLEEDQGQSRLSIMELTGKKTKISKQKGPQCDEVQKLEKEYQTIIADIYNKRQSASQSVHAVCELMRGILVSSWEELDQWKEDQRVACTMLRKPREGIIEILDNMFEGVATVFVTTLGQVDRFLTLLRQLPFETDPSLQQTEQDNGQMDSLLLEHLQRVFIVDKHIPKQVLKVTNGKSLGFSMSVRLLGGHALGLSANKPKVSVKLFPEKHVDDVMVRHQDVACSHKIQNSTDKSFQFINRGNCFASFDHMILSGVKREGKGRNDDFVTDYKHAFVFFTTVKIQEKAIALQAMSLPIVITSQTSQECMARGTIIWGAAFPKSKGERSMPFEAQEEVEWKRFAEVMNALFVEYTKRPLTAENIKFLAKKAFREENDLNFDLQSISLKAILKDKVAGCDFPFWKWFMSCMNSVKDTLQSEWKEGLIYGFISKTQADRILQNEPTGTFLIRFSESNIESGQRADIHGYLTVAVNELHPQTGQQMVFHIKESLSHKDLSEKRLAPILDAYEVQNCLIAGENKANKKLLTTLWTPEQKYNFEDVFGKLIKEKESRNDGYRRGRYVIEIFLADQRPRRTSTQTQWAMSPPPQSPAQSDYSEMGSPMPDMGMNSINMNGMFPVPLQTPCSLPQQQPILQVARVQPINHTAPMSQIPTVVQENNESPMLSDGAHFANIMSQVDLDGASDAIVLDQVGNMLNFLGLNQEQALDVNAVAGIADTYLDGDGDVMLGAPSYQSV